MKLRQLDISNFRGIKSLIWTPEAGFNLLLGAGDAGKTTILDALDLALGPRWNVAVSDADFSGCDTTDPISITATVGELPSKLLGEPRFQTHFRGWRSGVLHDEPIDDESGEDEPVLSIRFSATESLEPTWRVFTNREPENGPTVLARDREILGVVRVAHYVDRHLNWGRGSALTQYTDELDNLTPTFAAVRRHTRAEFKKGQFPKLASAATQLAIGAAKLGVRPQSQFEPGLDIGALQSSAAAVGLFDGDIPTTQMGLGSRRLLTITMQLGRTDENSLLLLDEIESALEPYRIRALVRTLLENGIQVIATTHSPVVIEESADKHFFFARRVGQTCEVVKLDSEITQILKKRPQTLLCQRAVVCEGKTEVGFFRAARMRWGTTHALDVDALGIAEIDADGGTECGRISKKLTRIGLEIAIYADSDSSINLSAQDRTDPLLSVVQYTKSLNSEQALFQSLDESGCEIALACIREWRTGLAAELGTRFKNPTTSDKLLGDCLDETKTVQEHLGELATDLKWFKKEEWAQKVLLAAWDHLNGPLDDALRALETWCYGTDGS